MRTCEADRMDVSGLYGIDLKAGDVSPCDLPGKVWICDYVLCRGCAKALVKIVKWGRENPKS